jgi:YD repeat-containing protein
VTVSDGHKGPTRRQARTAATPPDAGTTTVTDPDGDATQYVQNADGEVTKVTGPLGHSRHAKYTAPPPADRDGRDGTGADDAGGNTTTYGRDGRNSGVASVE